MAVGSPEFEYTLLRRFPCFPGRREEDGSAEPVRLSWRQMATIGKRRNVKHVERRAKRLGVRRNPATSVAQGASARPASEVKTSRLKKPVHITEDEADILISMRREKEKRVSLAEALRTHGYELEG